MRQPIKSLKLIYVVVGCVLMGCASQSVKPLVLESTTRQNGAVLSPMGDPLPERKVVVPAADEVYDLFGNIVKAKNGMPIGEMPIDRYLAGINRKLGCVFTLEKLRKDRSYREKPSPLDRTCMIKNDLEIATTQDLIRKLREDLQGVTVLRSKENGTVIHLSDSDLKGLRDYALNRKVSLAFQGRLGDLPDAIGKQYPDIGLPESRQDVFPVDMTEVNFTEKDREIRALITRHAQMEKRYILWIADTVQTGKTFKTNISILEEPQIPQ